MHTYLLFLLVGGERGIELNLRPKACALRAPSGKLHQCWSQTHGRPATDFRANVRGTLVFCCRGEGTLVAAAAKLPHLRDLGRAAKSPRGGAGSWRLLPFHATPPRHNRHFAHAPALAAFNNRCHRPIPSLPSCALARPVQQDVPGPWRYLEHGRRWRWFCILLGGIAAKVTHRDHVFVGTLLPTIDKPQLCPPASPELCNWAESEAAPDQRRVGSVGSRSWLSS